MIRSINSFCRIDENQQALSSPLVNLFYYDLPKYFQDEYRAYDLPRFCTILQGSKQVQINQSESFTYHKDKFILLPPHAKVFMSMPEHTHALVYEFSDKIINQVKQQVADLLEYTPPDEFDYQSFKTDLIQDRLLILHQRIQEILTNGDLNVRFLIDLTCQEIVYELIKMQGCHSLLHHSQNHPITRAIRMMKSDSGLRMSISDIADDLNMSLANFSQKFKQITNQSPREYLTHIKLNKSKQCLEHLSVTDTALEVGYENISHFIRLFKNEFGLTPKQYQLNNERDSQK